MKKIFFIFISILFSVNVFGYSMSIKGMSHTKKFEKCKLTRYWDGNGYTIGWGHHLLKGESYKNISRSKADELFRKDIIKTNASINRLLKKFDGKVKFSQGFINGLGDLIYNCGEGGVKNSTFYKRWSKCRVTGGNLTAYSSVREETTLAPLSDFLSRYRKRPMAGTVISGSRLFS